ncbi:uncharacterized protein PG998_010570 [Apiospora kogelbergensis]|uniref:uncharacterized protein n=1 Tax=Apiospora kogelbergensis TaxID=1337665 RepID=UPI00312F4A0E
MAPDPRQYELLLGVGDWATTNDADNSKATEELDEMMVKASDSSNKYSKKKGKSSKTARKDDKGHRNSKT